LPGQTPRSNAVDLTRGTASRDAAAVRAAKEAVLRGLDARLEQGLDIEDILASNESAEM